VTAFITRPARRHSSTGHALRTGVLAACVLVSGCAVTLHGTQSSGGGSTAGVSSSQLSGSARFSGGKASLSSGSPVSPRAGGAQVSLGKGPTAVLIVGLMIADAVDYFGSKLGVTAKPEPRTDSILETCSCYPKPLSSE
jgi:hypothetical protein